MKPGVSIGSRRVGRRLAAIETYEFPSNVRRRVHLKHPSTLVDDMWHEFLLHTRDYAAFCDAAIGQFLHHEPEPRMSLDQAPANRSDGLLIILQRARQDDHCGPHALRLLFRVDQEAQLPGCRRYHVDCGGRERCYDASRQGWCACTIYSWPPGYTTDSQSSSCSLPPLSSCSSCSWPPVPPSKGDESLHAEENASAAVVASTRPARNRTVRVCVEVVMNGQATANAHEVAGCPPLDRCAALVPIRRAARGQQRSLTTRFAKWPLIRTYPG